MKIKLYIVRDKEFAYLSSAHRQKCQNRITESLTNNISLMSVLRLIPIIILCVSRRVTRATTFDPKFFEEWAWVACLGRTRLDCAA